MSPQRQLQVSETDTEDVRKQHNLVELMREAVDGSGSFMSRRAQQILWDRFRIAVVTCMASITIKGCFGRVAMAICTGVTA